MALGRVTSELPLTLPTGGQFKVASPFEPAADTHPIAFTDVFQNALEKVHESQQIAKEMKTEFAAGRLDDIHGMMIANQQAGIETRLLANVRSKMLEAFQELWRINV
jgi:flagellar hook-basal body complex protein FliE